ncbi:MAG: hypothetical protein JWQ96_2421 [Segetibacter sp.]|jgi:hypothetical protein|nr:hypothetical protein [Segetibacter sp.]
MLKQVSFIIIFLVSCSCSFAQYFYYDDRYYDKDLLWEGGLSVGLMNAVTDVGERKGHGLSPGYYDWKSTKLSYSIYGALLYKSTYEARLEITKGKVAGKDANSNSAYVRSRNLSYKSNIWEVSLVGSLHPVMLFNTESLPSFSPYVLAGVSVFSFKPQAEYNGEWVDLRPLNTEGQKSSLYPARKEYSSKALSLPVGLGLKYEYSAKFNIRMEGLYRFSNTDYLDDASTTFVDRSVFTSEMQKTLAHRYLELDPNQDWTNQRRGKANNKDNFFTISLKVGYVIGRDKRPSNVGRPE